MTSVRARILVSGLVQGVGFRYFVYREATRLGLDGFTRNLVTGEVEIEAEGDRSLVEELIATVRTGPRSAHVTDVSVEWRILKHDYSGFQIR